MRHLATCLIALCALLTVAADATATSVKMPPLFLSLTPAATRAEEPCPLHGGESVRGNSQRPAQESEHRPVPRRRYWLSGLRPAAGLNALVQRPNGRVDHIALSLEGNLAGIAFPTPPGNGPFHGANTAHVIEQGVEENTLVVRTAKWITMHHNCGWGHDYRADEKRIQPQPCTAVPFEIVIRDLWDNNFHSRVTSGNSLQIQVLTHGRPTANAKVLITSDKGWQKELTTDQHGTATVELVRDYYPATWQLFDRTHRGQFLVTAEYTAQEQGSYRNRPYQTAHYIASHCWTYSPSRDDYSSYAYGLLLGTSTLVVSGVGVYAYRERRKKPYKGIVFDE